MQFVEVAWPLIHAAAFLFTLLILLTMVSWQQVSACHPFARWPAYKGTFSAAKQPGHSPPALSAPFSPLFP